MHFTKTPDAALWSLDCPSHQHCADMGGGSRGLRCKLQRMGTTGLAVPLRMAVVHAYKQ